MQKNVKKSPYALLSNEITKVGKMKKINFSSKSSFLNTVSSGNPKKEKEKPEPKNEPAKDFNIPDRSYGDFYCSICDSHMNSESMWEDHVVGRRHAKNLKKGNPDSKYEELPVESDIKYELRNVKDPVVGLSYIHEIRRKEPEFPPYYNCFLCHGNISSIPLVIEHVISMKHRLNYIKENEPAEHELLTATNLRKDHLEPLVEEAAAKLEQKYGRGEVLVKQEKVKAGWEKRPLLSDNDESDNGNYQQKPAKKPKIGVTEPSSWKPVNSSKAFEDKKEKFMKDKKSEPYYSDDEHFDKYSSKKIFPRDKKDISPPHYSHSSRSYKKGLESHHDYPKRYEYHEDYHRERKVHIKRHSISPQKNKYETKIPHFQEQEKRRHSPVQSPPDEYDRYSSPGPSGANLLPHEMSKKNQSGNFTNAAFLKDFIEKVLELPTDVLLKIFAAKMENMEVRSIEELSYLSKIVGRGQILLVKNLPPEIQEAMKQNRQISTSSDASNSTLTVPSNSSNIETNKLSKSQSDISFIKDILNIVKGGQPSTSYSPLVNQNPTQQFNAAQQFNAVNSSIPTTQHTSLQQYQSVAQSSHVNNQYGSLPNYYNNTAVSQSYQQVNTFQTPQSNSYVSMPSQGANYSYSGPQPSNVSSGIPGLTLSSTENTEQAYNNSQNITSPTKSYETKNYYYGY